MKRTLLLTTLMCLVSYTLLQAQNVFDPTLPLIQYSSGAALGSPQKPNPEQFGLQRWVYNPTKGISGTWTADEVSAFKAYYINRNGNKIAFRLKYPKSYQTNPTAEYPLMLFFHGLGEAACPSNGGIYNNEKQLLHGARDFAKKVENGTFDGFLLYPQVLADGDCFEPWSEARSNNINAINSIIDSLIKYARVDEDRIVVNGLSDGGSEAWNYTRNNARRVAALAPSSATISSSFASFVHVPVWFATGGKDANPSPAQAQTTYSNGLAAGANIRYTLFPNGGHGIWNNHWAQPGYTEFLARGHKANPLVYFNNYETCPGLPINVKLGITGGHNTYEWEKDGVVIARRVGATSTILVPDPIIDFTGNEITVDEFGTYRVRFKRSSSSDWSEWSPLPAVLKEKQPTQTPNIQVAGLRSKVLSAPDGSSTVPLTLPDGYDGYLWYNATTNALIDSGQVFNAPVGEYKAQVVQTGSCSTLFSPIFKVVNAGGNPKPEPARNLTATAASVSSIQLDWNENPNAGSNETGYEIYRATTAGGPYTLIFITAPNVVTYTNTGLKSNAAYYYIVRAVNDFGAAASTNEATAKTQNDATGPTAPNNLQYRGSTLRTVSLRWSGASDVAGIKRYDIYADGKKMFSTTSTSATIQGLDSLTTYTFTVRAVDNNENVSEPSNQVVAYTHRQGVNYKYYNGTWDALPDFSALTPVKEGWVNDVSGGTNIRTQSDNYGFIFSGYIYIPVTGTYSIGVRSNDGSKLYFDQDYTHEATPFVNNDGLRANAATVLNTVDLTQGYHRFTATYFEKDGSEAMELRWRSADAGIPNEERIPSGFLSFEATNLPGAPAAPSELSATANAYNRITVNWTDNNAGSAAVELQRSTTVGGTYTALATVPASQNTYVDTTVLGNRAYFYKARAVRQGAMSGYAGPATATTLANPATPTSPNNLAIQLTSRNSVRLTFNDRSNNETGFEIQRSVGSTNAFRKLAELPANEPGGNVTFNDSSLFSNVTYYYRVRAMGIAALSGFSNTVNAKTGNQPPVMSDINDFTMKYGTTYSLPINAVDPDGDALTFTPVNFPAFATLEQVSNGNANIVFNPRLVNRGNYSLRIIVQDGNQGADTTYFRMVVNANDVPTMSPIADVTLKEGEEVNIPVSANDVGGNQRMVWKVAGLPSFATFINNGNGNGTIKLAPWFAHSGTYNSTIIVDDGLGAWTSRSFVINVENVDTTVDDGSLPARALGLKAETIVNRGIQLTWDDRAYNETDYQVFRSTTPAGPFTQANTGINLQNRTSFLDSAVAPYTTYYYYVVGVNGAGSGASSDTVNALTGNAIPVISAIADVTVKADASVQRDFTVTDDAGDVVTVSINNKPAFVDLQDLGSGNYRIVASPGNTNLGWYSISVNATDDKGGVATRTFALLVSDKNTRSVFVNVGPNVVPQPWNNWATAQSSGSITNLVDETNTPTSFGIASLSGWSGVNTLGHVTANNSGIYPDSVLAGGLFESSTSAKTFRFSGLNPAMRYNLIFVGSKNEGLDSRTEFRVQGTTNRDTLNARYNVRLSANLNNIAPNASGQIVVEVKKIGGAFAYLNAIAIEEFEASAALMNPVNLYAEPVDRTTVAVSWSDRLSNENQVDGYQLDRATDPSFTMNLQTIDLPGNTTEYINTNLSDNTRYYYRVRGKVGATFTGYSNVAQTITPKTRVLVNFNFNVPSVGLPWNDLEYTPSLEQTFPNLVDESGVNTGLRLSIVNIFNGENNLGRRTTNNSGVVPDNVLAANYWLDKTQVAEMRLTGLNHSKRYRIGFIGSQGDYNIFERADYTATYTIGNRTVYLNSWENTSKIVYIGDIAPDENGEILIQFSTTESAVYGFNAGMIITAYDDVPGGTVLNRMKNDNAGVLVQGAAAAPGVNDEVKYPVRVYPNPFTNMLKFDFFNSSASNQVSVELYDMSGRLAYRKNFGQLGKGINTLRFNPGDGRLKTGVYMYTLSVNGKAVQTGKIVRAE